MIRKRYSIVIVLCTLTATAAWAFFSSSGQFQQDNPTLATGGGPTVSTSFRMTSLNGQTAIGRTTSSNFSLDHGFYSESASALSPVPGDKSIPMAFRLANIYPNPLNPTATIEFDIPRPSHTTVRIYDMQGRLVRTLVDEDRAPGRHMVVWDGRDKHSGRAASGLYLVKMNAGDFSDTRKITLLK